MSASRRRPRPAPSKSQPSSSPLPRRQRTKPAAPSSSKSSPPLASSPSPSSARSPLPPAPLTLPSPAPRRGAADESLAALQRNLSRADLTPGQRQQLDVSVGALHTALEELHVTQEELHAQNEQLVEIYQQLSDERQRYRELFDYAPDAYLVTDSAGAIHEVNFAAAALFNVPIELLHRKLLVTLVDQADRRRFREELLAVRAAPDRPPHLRWRMTRRHRLVFDADVTFAVVRDAGGEIRSIRWLFRDVTHATESARQLHEYQKRLRNLAAELARAEERERRQIAVDIHDRISQNLAMAKLRVASLRAHCPAAAHQHVEAAEKLLEQTLEDTRTLTFELSPPILYELGLVPALQWLAEQTRRQYALKVSVDGSKRQPAALNEEARVMLFRAVRELLINVVKHADATAARVSVRAVDGGVRVTVADDGRGFDPNADHARPPGGFGDDGNHGGGFGLFSLRNRVEQLGGKLEISSVSGEGTRVTLFTPAAWGAEKKEVDHGDAYPAGG